ncbi:uncharacterized protein LAJ45_09088 [Morchella importuna]|uniref:uncharacterized protein n=1 Tax=Morchella importuna TaxID=1174673 RepID=UPI001E8E6BE3|nr:uncharacterized protein LAJ45_09088 [Morchella importuna]KAH8146714.1 hypothetical protein LAJ45_09088 [Morchella importuna]
MAWNFHCSPKRPPGFQHDRRHHFSTPKNEESLISSAVLLDEHFTAVVARRVFKEQLCPLPRIIFVFLQRVLVKHSFANGTDFIQSPESQARPALRSIPAPPCQPRLERI